jgi:hypothetical protein
MRPPTWLLMFRAYIDESGHESRDWMFIAGFMGREERWGEFIPKWQAGLGPQRKSLHMHDLRWSKESTRRLLARLGPIPSECGLEGMIAGVRFQDYEDLVSGRPEEKTLKAYLAALIPMIVQALRGIPDTERLELVFEQQNEYEPFANMALEWVAIPDHQWKRTVDGKPKLAKWSFVPKGSTSLTEPADYLAYALREVWTNKKSKKAQWCTPILAAGRGRGYGVILNRALIRKIITDSYMRASYQRIQRRINDFYRK